MPELLIVGDAHLGRLATIFPNKDWQAMSVAPLQQVDEYAKKYNIKHIIQLGDVFDVPNPSQELLTLLTDFLLTSKNNWYINLGNHDHHSRRKHSCVFLRYLAKRRRLTNCRFFPKETRLTIAGVPTVILPWPKRRSKLLTGPPSLVIAHVERAGAHYDNGRKITRHNFKLGRHFWCIGDLHEFQTDDNLIFSGAVSQLRFGDSEAKYFLHLRVKTTEDKITVRYKRIRFVPQFILRDLTINKLADLAQLDKLAENVYVRLIIQQDVAVPEQYFRHPQVIKHRFFGNKNDLRAIRLDSFNLQIAKSTIESRISALQIWLRQQTQLPKQRRRQAIKYAERLERKLLAA